MNSQPYIVSKEIYQVIEALNKQTNMEELENKTETVHKTPRQLQREKDIETIKNWTSENLQGPKRLEDETFDDYKNRRRQENLWYKLYTTPGAHLVWLSKTVQEDPTNKMLFWSPGNTYIKSIHGDLESE